MSNATSPRKRGQHAGWIAHTRFVEIENTLPTVGWPSPAGLVIEAEGVRLVLAERAAVAILADLFGIVRPGGKGGRS